MVAGDGERTAENGVDGEEVGADGEGDHGEGEGEEFDYDGAIFLISFGVTQLMDGSDGLTRGRRERCWILSLSGFHPGRRVSSPA